MIRLFLPAAVFFLSSFLFSSMQSCGDPGPTKPRLNGGKPELILWAWERPEDLRFLDRSKFGVAFLEQTLNSNGTEVIHIPRRQPLKVESNTYLIAVTRIEIQRGSRIAEADEDRIIRKIVSRIVKSEAVKGVRGVQIDFDAVESERNFYRKIIDEVRQNLKKDTSLSITALASWCAGDLWLKDLPIDEAIPMLFDMGKDDQRIRNLLNSGVDWNETLCKASYGLSVNQPSDFPLAPERSRYYFNSRPWRESDLKKIN